MNVEKTIGSAEKNKQVQLDSLKFDKSNTSGLPVFTQRRMKGKSVLRAQLSVESQMSTNNSSTANLCDLPKKKLSPSSLSVPVTMVMGESRKHSNCRSLKIDCLMLSVMVLLVALQLSLYDTYFVKNGNEQREIYVRRHVRRMLIHEDYRNCSQLSENVTKSENNLKYLYYFIVPDLFAISAMAAILIVTIHERLKGECGCSKSVANIRFASIAWLVYAVVFDVKLVVSAKSFLRVLQFLERCELDEGPWGVNSFILMLSCSSVIFLTLILSHHAPTRDVREVLHSITEVVTFDILDGVHFFAILLNNVTSRNLYFQPQLENLIIGLVCVNFLLPSVSLTKLSHKLAKSQKGAKRHVLRLLIEDDISAILFLCCINLPYFVIRCLLWHWVELEMSVFLVKNAIMIIIQFRQIWIYTRRIVKFCSQNSSDSQKDVESPIDE